jgi:hypothetical protein
MKTFPLKSRHLSKDELFQMVREYREEKNGYVALPDGEAQHTLQLSRICGHVRGLTNTDEGLFADVEFYGMTPGAVALKPLLDLPNLRLRPYLVGREGEPETYVLCYLYFDLAAEEAAA